jgi:hypothetical protein
VVASQEWWQKFAGYARVSIVRFSQDDRLTFISEVAAALQ